MADVKVKLPDGRVGMIPESNLEEAIKRGATKVEEEAPSAPSMLESAGRGAASGASLGLVDELAGLVEAGGQAVGLEGLGNRPITQVSKRKGGAAGLNMDTLMAAYRQGRETERAANKAASEENPMSYGAGELAGGLVVPMGAAAEAKTAGEGIRRGMVLGGVAGGIAGAGTSEADLTKGEVIPMLKEAGESAVVGGGLGGLLGVLPAAAKGLKNTASEFKSPQEFANVFSKYRAGEEIGTRASSEAITEKAQGLAKDIGKTLADVKGYAGSIGGEARIGGEAVPAESKYQELVEKIKGITPGSIDEERLLDKYKNMLDRLVGKTTSVVDGEPQVVFTRPDVLPEEIQKTKTQLGKILAKNKDLPYEGEQLGHEIHSELGALLGEGLDETAQAKLAVSNTGYKAGLEAQAKAKGIPAQSGTTLEARMMYDDQVNKLVNTIEGTFAKPGATESVDIKNALKIAKDNVETMNNHLMSLTQDTQELANLKILKDQQMLKLDNLAEQIKKQALDIHSTRVMMGESPFGGEGIIRKVTGISGQAAKMQVAKGLGKLTRAVETSIPTKIGKITSGIYNASPEMMQKAMDTLTQQGSPYAEKLRAALSQPDRKRNALLFTLLQQPGFRQSMASTLGMED